MWDEHDEWRRTNGTFYLPPTEAAVDAARRWVKSIRHLVFTIPDCDGQKVRSGNRLALLDDCDLEWLSLPLASKLRLPKSFVDVSVMPKVKLDLISGFDARVCYADWPEQGFRDGGDTILNLYRDPSEVPDIFSAE